MIGLLFSSSVYVITFLDYYSSSLCVTCLLFFPLSSVFLPPFLSLFSFLTPLFLMLGHCLGSWGHPSSRRKWLGSHDDKSCQVSLLNFILRSILTLVHSPYAQLPVDSDSYKIPKFRCFWKCSGRVAVLEQSWTKWGQHRKSFQNTG